MSAHTQAYSSAKNNLIRTLCFLWVRKNHAAMFKRFRDLVEEKFPSVKKPKTSKETMALLERAEEKS